MPAKPVIMIDDHLRTLTPATRPIIEAALDAVRAVAPRSVEEVAYQSHPPSSKSAMWKLVRFRAGGEYVVGIGTFPRHAALFFYRGRELEDPSQLLQGGGKDMRFVTLRRQGDVQTPAVERLLRNAFDQLAPGLRARASSATGA